MKELIENIKEAIDDLERYVKVDYPQEIIDNSQTMARRYNRDINVVNQARKALNQLTQVREGEVAKAIYDSQFPDHPREVIPEAYVKAAKAAIAAITTNNKPGE